MGGRTALQRRVRPLSLACLWHNALIDQLCWDVVSVRVCFLLRIPSYEFTRRP